MGAAAEGLPRRQSWVGELRARGMVRGLSRLFGRRRRETMSGVFQNGLIIPHIDHRPVPVRAWDIHRFGLRPGQHRVEFSVSERTGVAKKIRIASSV